MVYRENAFPQGEIGRRSIEEQKKKEFWEKYIDALAEHYSQEGEVQSAVLWDGSDIPQWAKDMWLERLRTGAWLDDANAAEAEKRPEADA